MMNTRVVSSAKPSKACDECKTRKVRCAKAPDAEVSDCINCLDRGISCHFSPRQKRLKQTQRFSYENIEGVAANLPSDPATYSENIGTNQNSLYNLRPNSSPLGIAPAEQQWLGGCSKKLYVDLLLEQRGTGDRSRNEDSILKQHDQFVGSSGIAFFSEQRIASISERLGHRKLWGIMETLSTSIASRMNGSTHPSATAIRNKTPSAPLQFPSESAKSYISAYFSHMHPIYPFLMRQSFEEKAFDPNLARLLQDSVPFSALYHTVLAIGCQYRGGGSFEPGGGTAWKLYEVALASLSEVLVSKEPLLSVQAVLAMAIFAHNSSCVQIGNMLTTEAARMAQSIGLNKAVYHGQNESACHRTFWVVFMLEKLISFACNQTSVLADCDIGTPIPEIPEAVFAGFDWFYSMSCFGRLISKAHSTLFSISATLMPAYLMQAAIDAFNCELEQWKNSIPDDFRPGIPFQASKFTNSSSIAVALRVHYQYHSVVIAMSRLSLSLRLSESCRPMAESRKALLNAAQVIVEVTRYIDTEAYTPIWILASMPLTALFILFDFIVHNPTHTETRRNMSLLGAVAGYFCRLEFASDGALQTSLLMDFAHIARDYVQDVESGVLNGANGSGHVEISHETSLVNTDPETPALSLPGSDLVDQALGYSSTTEDFCYPIESVLFPMGSMFSEGYDLGGILAGCPQEISGVSGECIPQNGYS